MEQVLIISSILTWLVLLMNLILTFAVIRKVNIMSEVSDENGNPMPKIETLKLGQMAPPFKAEVLDGAIITLSDYVNRPFVLLFVTPSCEPCRKIVPTLETLSIKARQSNISLLLVVLANEAETRSFAKEFNLNLPVLIAQPEENTFMSDYMVGGTPFYCLVNEKSQVGATGFLDREWRSLTEKWSVGSDLAQASTS